MAYKKHKVLYAFVSKAFILVFFFIGILWTLAFVRLGRDEQLYVLAVLNRSEGARQAPWFDEVKFRRVHIGMPIEGVLFLLGQPLSSSLYCQDKSVAVTSMEKSPGVLATTDRPCPDSELYLSYVTQGDGASDYRTRGLTVKDGKVASIVRDFSIE